VSRVYYTPGNLAIQDQTLLTTVVSVDPIYAYFDVDEPTVLRVRRAIERGEIKPRPGRTGFPVLMGLQDEKDYPHQGTVDFVNNAVNPSTGTLALRGVFANPQPASGVRLLQPGMFVRIRLPIGDPKPRLLVIDRAIGSDQWPAGVAFCDLLNPRAVRHFSGHQTPVAHVAWSRDNRHLASLDSRFEVRVWTMDRDVSAGPFRVPHERFYASNAAVALSDDGNQLAFASGGENKAYALILDLPGGNELGSWEFGGGFENLACTGANKFLLVREELDGDQQNVQTVVWQLEAGKERSGPRPIRRSQPTDERRFLHSGLTPDGRYYRWLGPRLPEHGRRVEVREVVTGKLVKELRDLPGNGEQGAFLSPDGRYLWTRCEEGQLYDLGDVARPVRRTSGEVRAVSPDGRWLTCNPSERTLLMLKKWGDDRDWLVLADQSSDHCVRFSPDSRYLAIGKRSGHVTVVDLPALQQEIADFDKTLPK
jgi:WD40 repeat protein